MTLKPYKVLDQHVLRASWFQKACHQMKLLNIHILKSTTVGLPLSIYVKHSLIQAWSAGVKQ